MEQCRAGALSWESSTVVGSTAGSNARVCSTATTRLKGSNSRPVGVSVLPWRGLIRRICPQRVGRSSGTLAMPSAFVPTLQVLPEQREAALKSRPLALLEGTRGKRPQRPGPMPPPSHGMLRERDGAASRPWSWEEGRDSRRRKGRKKAVL